MTTVAKRFQVIENGVTYEFEAAEEGGYVVHVPAAPGCWSEGDSFEEAFAMIKDALQGWVVLAKDRGIAFAPELNPRK